MCNNLKFYNKNQHNLEKINFYHSSYYSFNNDNYDTKEKFADTYAASLGSLKRVQPCFSLHRYDTKAKPQITTFLEKKLHNYSFFSKLLSKFIIFNEKSSS